MSTLIQIPVSYYDDKGQLADGERKLAVYLQTLSDEQTLEIIRNSRTPGWMTFKPNDPLTQADLAEIPEAPVEGSTKSPSERLRAVMYVYWDTCTNRAWAWPIWYEAQMEKLIEQWKARLPERDHA